MRESGAEAPNAVRALLESRGLSPRKMFGQNFMADANFAAAIARDANADEHTLIIEVGPGTGILTRALLESHPRARVLAIEIDRGLSVLLRETFAADTTAERLTLLEGDALESKQHVSRELLAMARDIQEKERRGRCVLCANLPYNIATPLIANFAAETDGFRLDAAVVTIQLELAQRMIAGPDAEAYGALSALLALRAEGKIVRRGGAEIFWPRPKVDSAVLELRFREWGGGVDSLSREEAPGFQEFLKQVFSQRRKTLRALLRPKVVPEVNGVRPESRAEALTGVQLLEVFRKLI